jgi:predicted nucleic acid-binding protein
VRGLLDTSVFIAAEQGRNLDADRIPDEVAVSVVTLTELELGVHMAGSEAVRATRLRTLRAVETAYVALPIDEMVSSSFAELVAAVRKRGGRAGVQDAWIAATAHAHDVAVYTQDTGFDSLDVDVVRV